ncbi:MAG: low molecular weight protein arginine phosphatase [Anaerofustis sp.]
MKKILFVCTGNTCRSPIAEGIFNDCAKKSGLGDMFRADSAGIDAIEGDIVSPKSVEVCRENGIDIQFHTVRQIDEAMLEESDLVFGMTMNHRDLLRKRYPQYSNKIYMLGEYAGTVCCSGDIPDPFGLPLDRYRKTYRILDGYVGNLMEHLKEEQS